MRRNRSRAARTGSANQAPEIEAGSQRRERAARTDPATGALEIEFEDEDGPAEYAAAPAGWSRDLRPILLTSLAAAVLGAALWAARGSGAGSDGPPTVSAAAPNYAAFVVTVGYQGAHLLSVPQRRIEIDLRVVPVRGATVKIISYYISENGVVAHADPAPSVTPLPAAGLDVKLDLTVTDCSVVPIGESMGFVDVVADGPTGITDRFTILGDRYSADVAHLLRTICPGRANGQSQGAGTVVAGS